MKKVISLLLIAVTLFGCCNNSDRAEVPQAFVTPAKAEAAGFNSASLRRVDSLMAFYVREGMMANFASFVARNGQIVHHKAYGYKDSENIPLKTDDIFRWASQSKAITTVALLTLFEENKFMLDDPVDRYLPMFANPQVYVSGSVEDGNLITRPAKRKITIRHLLSHSSGYSYKFFGEDLQVIHYDQPVTTREVVERIARTPLMHDPGEKYTYGFGIDIAGYLAEVLSGKNLYELMKERILDPLEMNDTHFYLPPAKHDRLVKVYTRPSPTERYSVSTKEIEQIYPLAADQPYHGGGAGLCGTIENYARFCQMILNKGEFNGKRILGRKTVELMYANQLLDVEGTYRFSLGFEIYSHRNSLRTMASEGTLKWGGAYGTQYFIDPTENMIVLFYTNASGWNNPSIADRFLISVYQALE